MQADQRIALTVIGGFLGAGKSTLLNRILQNTQRRTTVLVNDFGSVNVDASLVKSRDGDTINLSNGCACCTLGGGLYEALSKVMERQPVPEWIVIEASGVSDPARIAQVGMSDPLLELESVLVLADASAIRWQSADPLLADTIIRQLAGASILLLSKTDLAGEKETEAVKQWLVQYASGVPQVPAEVDLNCLQMHIDARHVCQLTAPFTSTHHHEHDDEKTSPFVSWFWSVNQPLNAEQLTAALKGLPRCIVRAKGWVITGRHGEVLVQYASGRVRYSQTPPAVPVPHGLVLIAAGDTDQQMINQRLQAAICQS